MDHGSPGPAQPEWGKQVGGLGGTKVQGAGWCPESARGQPARGAPSSPNPAPGVVGGKRFAKRKEELGRAQKPTRRTRRASPPRHPNHPISDPRVPVAQRSVGERGAEPLTYVPRVSLNSKIFLMSSAGFFQDTLLSPFSRAMAAEGRAGGTPGWCALGKGRTDGGGCARSPVEMDAQCGDARPRPPTPP